jgi:hypothetical protein
MTLGRDEAEAAPQADAAATPTTSAIRSRQQIVAQLRGDSKREIWSSIKVVQPRDDFSGNDSVEENHEIHEPARNECVDRS